MNQRLRQLPVYFKILVYSLLIGFNQSLLKPSSTKLRISEQVVLDVNRSQLGVTKLIALDKLYKIIFVACQLFCCWSQRCSSFSHARKKSVCALQWFFRKGRKVSRGLCSCLSKGRSRRLNFHPVLLNTTTIRNSVLNCKKQHSNFC